MRMTKYSKLNTYFGAPANFNSKLVSGRMLVWVVYSRKTPEAYKAEIMFLDPMRYLEVKVRPVDGYLNGDTLVSVRVAEEI